MFPRAMNNKEKASLKIIKDSGLYYDLKFLNSYSSGGYVADVPLLCGTYSLDDSKSFENDLKRFKNDEKN